MTFCVSRCRRYVAASMFVMHDACLLRWFALSPVYTRQQPPAWSQSGRQGLLCSSPGQSCLLLCNVSPSGGPSSKHGLAHRCTIFLCHLDLEISCLGILSRASDILLHLSRFIWASTGVIVWRTPSKYQYQRDHLVGRLTKHGPDQNFPKYWRVVFLNLRTLTRRPPYSPPLMSHSPPIHLRAALVSCRRGTALGGKC